MELPAEHATLFKELAEIAAAADPELGRFALSLIRPSLRLTVTENDPRSADSRAPAKRRGGPVPKPAGESCYGGLPPLPAGVPWPDHQGRPLTLLARLDCAALAPLLDAGWKLPRDGVLLFFYDDDFAEFEGGECFRLLHVPREAPLRQPPEGCWTIPTLPLSAEYALSVPDFCESRLDEVFRKDPIATMQLISDLKDRLPSVRHRMLGWSDSMVPGPEGHRLLLQLEAEQGTAWGEAVAVTYWIPDDDLPLGRLDRVRGLVEVA